MGKWRRGVRGKKQQATVSAPSGSKQPRLADWAGKTGRVSDPRTTHRTSFDPGVAASTVIASQVVLSHQRCPVCWLHSADRLGIAVPETLQV